MTRRRNTPPKPIPTRRTAPGLIDVIPVFLNTLAHDNENESITVKSMWYELLLDLLTQATIECYLCDSYNSIDALLEIFSYGDIDPSDYHSIIQKVMTMMILTLLLLVLAIMAMYNIFGCTLPAGLSMSIWATHFAAKAGSLTRSMFGERGSAPAALAPLPAPA